MPVAIGEVTSTVHVTDGGMPWPPEAVERLVQLVLQRLKERERWDALTRQERELADRMTQEE